MGQQVDRKAVAISKEYKRRGMKQETEKLVKEATTFQNYSHSHELVPYIQCIGRLCHAKKEERVKKKRLAFINFFVLEP